MSIPSFPAVTTKVSRKTVDQLKFVVYHQEYKYTSYSFIYKYNSKILIYELIKILDFSN
jgi:hypothetical protein